VLPLAGLDKSYLVEQMKAFKSGARPATVMHQISKGYSDAQIDILAGYFAAQKK
jgi:sulfide dehydrogenase cytochrome subunit